MAAAAFCFKCDREHALHRADRAIEAEFANHAAIVGIEGFRAAGSDHCERDGQIERGSFLFQIGGREVHGFHAIVEKQR